MPSSVGVAVGDFDGDRRLDFATIASQGLIEGAYRYRVDLALTSATNNSFFVEAPEPGGLYIVARDVDGDHDLDLVVSTALGHRPIGVWINDGHGRFTRGDAAAYPQFIWLPEARFIEPAGNPHLSLSLMQSASGRWAVPSEGTTTRLPSEMTCFYAVPILANFTAAQIFHRLRAPPSS